MGGALKNAESEIKSLKSESKSLKSESESLKSESEIKSLNAESEIKSLKLDIKSLKSDIKSLKEKNCVITHTFTTAIEFEQGEFRSDFALREYTFRLRLFITETSLAVYLVYTDGPCDLCNISGTMIELLANDATVIKTAVFGEGNVKNGEACNLAYFFIWSNDQEPYTLRVKLVITPFLTTKLLLSRAPTALDCAQSARQRAQTALDRARTLVSARQRAPFAIRNRYNR